MLSTANMVLSHNLMLSAEKIMLADNILSHNTLFDNIYQLIT
jgi:hypothetical protein